MSWIFALPYFFERCFRARATFSQRLPTKISACGVGIKQRGHRILGSRQAHSLNLISAFGRRNAIYPTAIHVADLVSADPRVVPVGHEKRPIGSNGYINRPEPLILLRF